METNQENSPKTESFDVNRSLLIQNYGIYIVFFVGMVFTQFKALVNFNERDNDTGWCFIAISGLLLLMVVNQILTQKSKVRKALSIMEGPSQIIKGFYWKLPLWFISILLSMFLVISSVFSIMENHFEECVIFSIIAAIFFTMTILIFKKGNLKKVL